MADLLQNELPADKYGNKITDVCSGHSEVSGVVADQVVFTGKGIISHITIWKDVDGGTIQLKDTDGNAITPAGITDYGGSFVIKLLVTNGCKVTTTGFTGGLLTVYYRN